MVDDRVTPRLKTFEDISEIKAIFIERVHNFGDGFHQEEFGSCTNYDCIKLRKHFAKVERWIRIDELLKEFYK